jgi:hypothetical protein
MDAFSTEILLLHLIHRRMRQRGLMILNPSQIAGIKPAAALVAFEEVLTLAERRTADALAYHAPVRPRLVHRHDRGHVHLKKNQPRFPEADSHTAQVYIRPAAIAVSYCHGGCRRQTIGDGLTSFHLNGDLLGAIAQAALKGAHLWLVRPRYHTCKHHRSVAFRAWRPFNFSRAATS